MGAMKKKWEEIKTDGVLQRPLLNFDSQEEAKQDADRWCLGCLLGSGTVADAGDGTQAQEAQEESEPAMPMEMLLQAIQTSAYTDRAEREKAAGFNLEREMKPHDATEARMWASIAREERIREKALKKRKKSTDGKGPSKLPRQGSLARSVTCAPAGLARATANPTDTKSAARAPTANEHAGSRSMDGMEEEQEHNEREPSNGASSA